MNVRLLFPSERRRQRQMRRTLHSRAINGIHWMREQGESDAALLARANATLSDRELSAMRNYGRKTVAYVRSGRYENWDGMAN